MELILSIGFIITGFITILLWFKKENKSVNRFAILILTLWCIRFILYYLKSAVDLSSVPWLFYIDQNLFFLDGVLLFWFTKSLNKEEFNFFIQSFHLIPFLIAITLTFLLFVFFTGEQLNDIYQATKSKMDAKSYRPPLQELIFILGILIQNIFYLFYGYKKIKKYNLNLLSNYSTVEKLKVEWLSHFFMMWLLLLSLPLIIYFTNYLFPLLKLSLLSSILMVSLVILAIYFSVRVINQYYASFSQPKTDNSNKSTLTNADLLELKSLFLTLESLMKDEKPYLDENLTLSKLSDLLNVKSTKLSLLLKTQTQGNFYDYVNAYRIDSVKKELLATNEQIIIIAYNNGFNSKSTFNKVFKTTTGLSPSEFKKRHLNLKTSK